MRKFLLITCCLLNTQYASPETPKRAEQTRETTSAKTEILVPAIQGDWWPVAGDPDLGELTDPKQQPVDFAIWQAADGTWQIWSCIRFTKCGGMTRLFHHWESAKLTDSNWKPMGIAMQADEKFGERPGGLQAPFVFKHEAVFYMAYGDWTHICMATSIDGKQFARRVNTNSNAAMFSEAPGENTRDPMIIRIGDLWYCYYTDHPNNHGAVYCRSSKDLRAWSEGCIVAEGGQAGTAFSSAECPFVIELQPGQFYLFRTQRYGKNAQTSVYHSTDPLDFGKNQDTGHFICTLPIAAPEIFKYNGQFFIATLLPSLKGVQIAKLDWIPQTKK